MPTDTDSVMTFDPLAVDAFVGPPGARVGEERRVDAALHALGTRCPSNVDVRMLPPEIVSDPEGRFPDYDMKIAFCFATFGGSYSDRCAVLCGDAVFHVSCSEAISAEPLYIAPEDCDAPTLLARAADGTWHTYRGEVVSSEARAMVRDEVSRRTLTGLSPLMDGTIWDSATPDVEWLIGAISGVQGAADWYAMTGV